MQPTRRRPGRAACAWAALILLSATGLGSPGARAAGKEADAVDRLMRRELAHQHIPGATLLVARDGRTEIARGYGLADVELDVPARPATVFQSGSVGKQFTATAVMMLVAEGKLRLDDPLTRFFPDAPPSWRAVTIRHLLSHTGGFGDYPDDFDYRRDYTEAELLKVVEGIPLKFPPGSDWAYANFGYLLLGLVIHEVTGKLYGEFLRERIFVPLGMRTTRILSESDIIPNRASGYRLVDGQLKNQEWISNSANISADGALYFSILDLARWDAALYSGKLLPQQQLEEMWRVVPLNDGRPNPGHYGYGWFIEERNGHPVVEHDGGWQGFSTYIGRYRRDRLTVVVLTNLADGDPHAIGDAVAALYLSGTAH